jgi:hypothetical protein
MALTHPLKVRVSSPLISSISLSTLGSHSFAARFAPVSIQALTQTRFQSRKRRCAFTPAYSRLLMTVQRKKPLAGSIPPRND